MRGRGFCLRPTLLWALGLAVAGCVSGCGKTDSDRPDWVIRSRLVFLSEDLASERAPLPPTEFRLLLPYIAGDLYGPPTTGDFIAPVVGADYRFQIDLNRSHKSLLASLQPSEFSLSYLHIEPAAARVARLAPMVLQRDGIEPVGRADWFDPDSKRALLLLYLDRPATISGRSVAGGRPLRYAIRTAVPGYVWVGRQAVGEETVYTVTSKPARLLLAVTPLTSARPTTASPARRDTPVR